MGSIKDQLLNIINFSNTTKSNDEDRMDIDQDEEINKQLSLYGAVAVERAQTPLTIKFEEEYVIWAYKNYQKEVNQEFENLDFQMAIGAIDRTHIPLIEASSKVNKNIYMSCKH
ncbi:hypothetical protein C2G38_2163917 [Gigaspora rosea]|uniref:Uncharacterized protein n=1 Tax=Gigaspora rosea TaxID=44941 RepID=A0A397VWS9_9GLOM|nr:hypothetical protein C2G38_2163917 [Gigaspora rosea]